MEQNQELTFYYINKKEGSLCSPPLFLHPVLYDIFWKFAERQRSKISSLVGGTTTREYTVVFLYYYSGQNK